MRDFRDAKVMAQTLREALKAKSVSVTHSESLELVARTLGFPDWNFLAAKIHASHPVPSAPATVRSAPSAGIQIPILALRDLVLFPGMVTPIFVGREKTKRAIARATASDGRILVLTQRRPADDDPALDALYQVGVTANVIHQTTLLDGTFKLFVSGIVRTTVIGSVQEDFLAAAVAPVEDSRGQTSEAFALAGAVLEAYQTWAKVDFTILPHGPGDPGALADAIAPLLSVEIEQRQKILETIDVVARLEAVREGMKAGQQAA